MERRFWKTGVYINAIVYIEHMRRIQLYVDNEVDEALSAEAARLGTSRSALVREAVRASLSSRLQAMSDSVDELVGSLDVEPDEDLDAVIYGMSE